MAKHSELLDVVVIGGSQSGKPIHRRGVTDVPGLYFLGLPWQHSRGSALLGFVHEDAAHLADRITSHAPRQAARRPACFPAACVTGLAGPAGKKTPARRKTRSQPMPSADEHGPAEQYVMTRAVARWPGCWSWPGAVVLNRQPCSDVIELGGVAARGSGTDLLGHIGSITHGG